MITTQGASDPEVHVMEDPSTEVDISKKTPDFGPSNTIFKAGDSVEFTATPKSQTVVSGSKAVATETNLFEKEKANPINYLEPLSGHYVQEPKYSLFKGGNPIPDAENISSEIVSCEKCEKVLLNEALYTAHVQTEHVDNTYVYECLVCKKTFQSQRLLRGHTLSIHTKPCPNCWKTNVEMGRWSENMKKTDERILSCTECKKDYTISSKRTKQTKLGGGMMKTADNYYACTECSKLFLRKADCVIHQSVHMEDKPFTCHLCDQSFTQKTNLKAHMRCYHPHENKA